jgi:hypothetical protein
MAELPRPSLPGADRPLGAGATCRVACQGGGRPPPAVPVDGDGVGRPGAVGTAGGVRGQPHVVGETGASRGEVRVASEVGRRGGGPGPRERWPFVRAATALFWPAGRPCSPRTVGFGHGDSAQRDTGKGPSASCGSWLPPVRSRLSPQVAVTGRRSTPTQADAEGKARESPVGREAASRRGRLLTGAPG